MAGCGRLQPACTAERESPQIGVADVARVVDLTMADEMQMLEHGGYGTRVSFAEHILHVDMDAFFVEVERRRRPELAGVAVVVGGLGTRGVVAAASYEARRRGVHSAMPMAHARRRCPHARFLPPDHGAYRDASAEVFDVLESFTPLVEPLSVDEAFLDISGLRFHHRTPDEVAERVRSEIKRSTGLPASAGIATSKLIAKLASEAAKPDGLMRVPAGSEEAFLHPLGVRALWGVGEATFARLEELGVATVGDLAGVPPDLLVRRLGAVAGKHLSELARGHDPRPVVPSSPAKSISVEATYDEDLSAPEQIDAELLRHADRLAGRLRAAGVRARTVQLKVRFSDFTTLTRSHTLAGAEDTAHGLRAAAGALLERVDLRSRGIRLLGLGAESLEPADAPRQLELQASSWEDVERAVDRVRDRFGPRSIGPASLSGDPQ